jgi:hypothetical protein
MFTLAMVIKREEGRRKKEEGRRKREVWLPLLITN